jgi:hypothetical protein
MTTNSKKSNKKPLIYESMFYGAFLYFLIAFLLLVVTFIRVIPA